MEEAGKLNSKIFTYKQIEKEQEKLESLNEEFAQLRERQREAINSGYIEYGSEAWSEMEAAISEVCSAIEEARNNLVSYNNVLNEVDWNRWEKVHDAIDGVANELEFIYNLINEDDLFTEEGDITDRGITAISLLAHEYDVYFAQVEEYQREIEQVQRDLAEDPYNQTLVDKLKELKEAQQDAASNAKEMKESMVDVTEKGIKKQIDYVKKLIEDYEELLESQKDQIDYAKNIVDQQKEINRLEKQYRAIQNDNSEESATKRQQLQNQIEEKRRSLQETQEDRRLTETKDMLSKFEESFEEFLENKLKDIEGIVREAINTANNNRDIIKDTVNDLAQSYGYTPSDTLKNTLEDMSRSFASYFDGQFENSDVASIADNVQKILEYYQQAQTHSNEQAVHDSMVEAVRHNGHVQTYTDENGNKVSGYFRDDGTRDENYTGWADKKGKQYRFENGELLTGSQFIDVDGKRYHLDEEGAMQTNWQYIDDKWYYMNNQGEVQTGWQHLNNKWYYLNDQGEMQVGAQTIDGKPYVLDDSGAMMSDGWKKYHDKWYYLDSSGVAKTGWFRDNNKWYLLNPQGEMLTGVQQVDGKTYYMDDSGAMQANKWQLADGKWYYLDGSGAAKVGWFQDKGTWYLANQQGEMLTGLQQVNGKTYYMNENGAMQANTWQKVGDKWYYLDSSGAAVTGWRSLKWSKGTDWFYFNPSGEMVSNSWIGSNGITNDPKQGDYYLDDNGVMVYNGKHNTNRGVLTFDKYGRWMGYKTGTSGVGSNGLYWTNEGRKAEAIIRKSDGAILTPLSKGDSVIPNSAMKNMYQALTDPAKYLKQYTTPDVRVIQNNNNSSNQPPIVNMQFIANGVQDANKFVNDLMNNKKLEKWVQEVTLGQANGNNNYKKYSYIVR